MLRYLRRSERGTVYLFVVLCLVIIGERRVADAASPYVAPGTTVLKMDIPEGDEIRGRLVAMEADIPHVEAPAPLPDTAAVLAIVPKLPLFTNAHSSPRAPPFQAS